MKNLKIRLETESDYRHVEELTREAFWNLYFPGCDEQYSQEFFKMNIRAFLKV